MSSALHSAAAELLARLGSSAVITQPGQRMLYEYDGGVDAALPDLVVFPNSRADLQFVVETALRHGLPLVPRGAGTGLSGGAIARHGGILVTLNRMRSILELDYANQRARIEPGVVNLELSNAAAPAGYYFVPDPSSQQACTIGGNVAENSGGPHTLAYGVTVNHVTGLEAILPDGRWITAGGAALDTAGPDITGLLTGSEGTLAIVASITVKLTRRPAAARTLLAIYDSIEAAAVSVSAVTAAGMVPAALEMLDGFTLRAVEDYIHAGYPRDSAAVLLIELEGMEEEVEPGMHAVRRLCLGAGAREVQLARDAEQRQRLWKGRKHAFGAAGRIAPSLYVMDGVIPRTRIAELLRAAEEIARRYEIKLGNIFHAGDGNLHPLVFFDQRQPGELERAVAASREIIAACVAAGGSISGEHGIGMEKDLLMPLIFSEDDLDFMRRIRTVFNPQGRLNPGKLLPEFRACRETMNSWQRSAPAAVPEQLPVAPTI